MSRSSAAQRPLTTFLTAVLAVLALMVASLAVLPSASATTEDDATQTSAPAAVETAAEEEDAALVTEEPVAVAAVPPAEEFEVETYGPECWDSSWNVSVYTDADTAQLRLVLQEDVDGAWETVSSSSFYDGGAGVYTEMLAEGVTGTFRAVVQDRGTPGSELVVVAGPVTVTGVAMDEGCEEDWEMPELPVLPEDEWTVADPGCGAITFTSNAQARVAVAWIGESELEMEELPEEPRFFFLAPGESRTVETSEEWVYWVSAVGVDEDGNEIEGEFAYAGEGEVVVSQDCPAEPTEPAEPAQPDGGHVIPGKVQTDGGANAATVALGLMLMGAAAVGLLRRAA